MRASPLNSTLQGIALKRVEGDIDQHMRNAALGSHTAQMRAGITSREPRYFCLSTSTEGRFYELTQEKVAPEIVPVLLGGDITDKFRTDLYKATQKERAEIKRLKLPRS